MSPDPGFPGSVWQALVVVRPPLTVLSPMLMLYTRDGVEVALISLEIWPTGLIVRLAGLPSEQTQALERQHEEDIDLWAYEGRVGPPPAGPGEDILAVELALSDDSGTTYVWRASSHGGSGRMFRAEWFFEPGPPDSSTELVVRVTREQDELASVSLSIESGAPD